jgi:hypothetical protein
MADQQPTIDSEWQGFRLAVFPDMDAKVQVEATCDSFYGGFYSAMTIMKLIGEPQVSEEQAMKIMTELDAEMTRYLASVMLRSKRERR